MPPKFSKALLAAGLAAALVGCGGGSSTTTMAGGEPTDPTAAESAAQQTLQVSYDTAKRRVDALSPSSGASQKKAAQDAVDVLGSLINTTVDLSDADKEKFSDYVETLSKNIDTKTAPVMTDGTDDDTSSTATATARSWLSGVSTSRLGNVPNWPLATTLAGPTPNPDLRDGWTVMNYDYLRGTTREKGKTFSMEVEKVTPGITRTWAELAALSQLPDRGDVINNYLGGDKIMVEATPTSFTAPNPNPENLVAGSGVVRQVIPARPGSETYSPLDNNIENFTPRTNGVNQVYTTQFNIKDLVPMTAADITSLSAQDQNNSANGIWASAADGSILRLSGSAANNQYFVKWKGISGKLRFIVPSATDVVLLRFHPTTGNLQIVPANGVFNDSITVSFQPVNKGNLLTANTFIHSEELTLRPGKTTTATTEFAYWASQNQSSSVVTVSTFARGGTGDMAFEDVTDIPQMLTGSAEYNGLAAGYYAMGTESNGEFTADAMLTANFGANTDSEMITVSGMIDNFMPITGDDNLSSWNLTLSPVTLNDDNLGSTFMGNTSGGEALGTWNGQFLGMANPGINLEDAADMTDDYPEAVVGNFVGHFPNGGHVAGAFGADLEE